MRRHRSWMERVLPTLALMLCDALSVNGSLIAVFLWRLSAGDFRGQTLPGDTGVFVLYLSLLNIAFVFTFVSSGLYTLKRGASRVDEAFKTVVAVSLGVFAASLLNYMLPGFGQPTIPTSGLLLVLGWVVTLLMTIVVRFLYRSILGELRQRGFDNRRVLIVGAREPGRFVKATISRSPKLGYQVQGFVSEAVEVGADVDGAPVLGKPTNIGSIIQKTQTDEVIIALSGRSSTEVLELVTLADSEDVEIKLYPDAFQLITNNEVSVGDVSGLPLIRIRNIALNNPINQLMKRALDLIVASLVLVLFSPIMLLIAALIKLESPGPAFFVQERVGLDGEPFPVLKFRGMRQDAPAMGNWTTRDDPRVTQVGRFIRRYSLDELPQFMNVLRGEMSVVGPRPEQPMYVEMFSQSIPRYVKRHKQKVGITGWAQVNGLRGDTSIEERTRYDLYYVENWSLLFDIKIIIKTALDTLNGTNSGY